MIFGLSADPWDSGGHAVQWPLQPSGHRRPRRLHHGLGHVQRTKNHTIQGTPLVE